MQQREAWLSENKNVSRTTLLLYQAAAAGSCSPTSGTTLTRTSPKPTPTTTLGSVSPVSKVASATGVAAASTETGPAAPGRPCSATGGRWSPGIGPMLVVWRSVRYLSNAADLF